MEFLTFWFFYMFLMEVIPRMVGDEAETSTIKKLVERNKLLEAEISRMKDRSSGSEHLSQKSIVSGSNVSRQSKSNR